MITDDIIILFSIYMITAPRRIRAGQVFQVFATILRMEYHENAISVRVSIVESDKEYTSSILKFERPSSRLMQLQVGKELLSFF